MLNVTTSENFIAMEISLKQLNGETLLLEVDPLVSGWELKRRIKEELWNDELTRRRCQVEVVLEGGKLLKNFATLVNVGISADSDLTIVVKEHRVRCRDKDELEQVAQSEGEIDSESLILAEVPDDSQMMQLRLIRMSSRTAINWPD